MAKTYCLNLKHSIIKLTVENICNLLRSKDLGKMQQQSDSTTLESRGNFYFDVSLSPDMCTGLSRPAVSITDRVSACHTAAPLYQKAQPCSQQSKSKLCLLLCSGFARWRWMTNSCRAATSFQRLFFLNLYKIGSTKCHSWPKGLLLSLNRKEEQGDRGTSQGLPLLCLSLRQGLAV